MRLSSAVTIPLLGLLVLFAAPAAAQLGCGSATDSYFGGSGFWPDNDPAGLWIGPVAAPDAGDGDCMLDVSFGLILAHGRVGDITLELWYDRDCDGAMDVGPVVGACRPGRACGSGGADLGCEASADFQPYEFHEDGAEPFGDPTCGAAIPGGCYAVAPESPLQLDVFDGERKDGCFWLFASDSAEGFSGIIKGWQVSLTSEFCAVPVDDATWAEIKTAFGN